MRGGDGMWSSSTQGRLLSRTLFIRSQRTWIASGPYGEMASENLTILTHLSAALESAAALISLSEGESGGSAVSILTLSEEWKQAIVEDTFRALGIEFQKVRT
jgi:hypothetical protein